MVYIGILPVLTILQIVATYKHKKPYRRIGKDVTNAKYPYIVAIGTACKPQRICTGSLIAPEWVLTAGHCIDKERLVHWRVFYGNLTQFPNTTYVQKIKDGYIAPNYNFKSLETAKRKQYFSVRNDIGLIFIEALPDQQIQIGKLSLVDFWSLVGHPVRHVGARRLNKNCGKKYNTSPLNEGHAVVVRCTNSPGLSSPTLCLRPKCSHSNKKSLQGDAGGPVLYQRMIVGVSCCRARDDTALYTAVAPYADWIQGTMEMAAKEHREKEEKEEKKTKSRFG